MNARAKGLRNERRTQVYLEKLGWTVFRLYQPPYAPQGAIDLVAISPDGREIKLVQVRSTQWGELAPLRALKVALHTTTTKEVWRWPLRAKEPECRMIA